MKTGTMNDALLNKFLPLYQSEKYGTAVLDHQVGGGSRREG